jgi:diaminohydroxyphosphoribosylaminopyrimidine deaminase/5-amino-6-(5-phosphoribosylamino)uracil reductase
VHRGDPAGRHRPRGRRELTVGDHHLDALIAQDAEPAAAEVPLTVVVSRAAARADTDALEAAGVQVVVATGENEPARVRSALEQLGTQGVTSVLLEGGPHLAGAFLDTGEIDEIRLFLAPLLLGGSAARDPLEGKGVERISEALRAITFDCESVGEDLLISARLREW